MSPEREINEIAGLLSLRKDPFRKKYLQGKLSAADLNNRGLTPKEKRLILKAARYHYNPDVGEDDLIARLGKELDRIREGRPLSFEKKK